MSWPALQDEGKRAKTIDSKNVAPGSGVEGRQVQVNLRQTDHTRGFYRASIGQVGDTILTSESPGCSHWWQRRVEILEGRGQNFLF